MMITRPDALCGGLVFASGYVYSPKGHGVISVRSQRLCRALKAADERFIPRYAARVRALLDAHRAMQTVLGPAAVLVPVPGRRDRSGVATAAERLADALIAQGVGHCAWRGLRRVCAVPKSATAASFERPSVMHHYDSFAVERTRLPLEHLVLIDDVVTKGRTLLAAAWRLRESFPGVRISAFALMRTMGRVSEVDRLLAPCLGEIRWLHGDAYRSP